MGGVKLPLALAELGLIDEYEFVVLPRIAGHGPTLFAGLSKCVDLKPVARYEYQIGRSRDAVRAAMNVVAERFELVREAGAGGMGVVWEARDRVSGGRVAVKVLGDRAHEERFLREAEVLAGLEHDAIVKYVAHDRGWLAMEWLEGEDLGQRLERGALSLDECSALAARVAGAIAEAHARGIVHRDLKPGNVFLVDGDAARAKVLDFGLARDVTHSSRPLTMAGAVMGSIGYLSPEQARGQADVDARSDVFSLGCIFFECLTGKAAFSGAHAVAVLAKLLVEDAPRVRSMRMDAPRALDELVARMLERDPQEAARRGRGA